MNLTANIKRIFINTASYLYILLFTYAAVTKLLDYNDFSIQIGQSPLLSAFAGFVAIAVPVTELLIVLLLSIPRSRSTGLYLSLCLMVMFTTYIFLILNFSSNIPCSCGGILEKMGWTEHLVFNIGCIVLALVALLMDRSGWPNNLRPKNFALAMVAGLLFSVAAIIALYLISESIIHTRNNFVRRFPAHARPELKKVDLQHNSYYFAGLHDDKIYLANNTTPLNITIYDTALQTKKQIRITIEGPDVPYRSLQVRIIPPYFFVLDGSTPFIYRGNIKDWKARPIKGNIPGFNFAEPMDSARLVYRRINSRQSVNELGILEVNGQVTKKLNPGLLEKQVDGIFDTDGMMLYNSTQDKVHYVYYYRNQFITAGSELNLISKRKTIDTVSRAVISTGTFSDGARTMSSPPLLINRLAAIDGNFLFINSERLGKYEDSGMAGDASVFDLYNADTGTYQGSMYVYHIADHKVKSFRVSGNRMYAISGTYLSVIEISPKLANME